MRINLNLCKHFVDIIINSCYYSFIENKTGIKNMNKQIKHSEYRKNFIISVYPTEYFKDLWTIDILTLNGQLVWGWMLKPELNTALKEARTFIDEKL